MVAQDLEVRIYGVKRRISSPLDTIFGQFSDGFSFLLRGANSQVSGIRGSFSNL